MFQLQAEHRHTAGPSASKTPLLRKRLYNERLIIIILMPYKKVNK